MASAQSSSPWLEIIRPFSLTASSIPIFIGAGIAWQYGYFSPLFFVLTLIGSIMLQAGTNIVNEFYDVKSGVDDLNTRCMSRVLVENRLPAKHAITAGITLLTIGSLIGIGLGLVTTPMVVLLAVIGGIGGYAYTAPPLQYKYKALGVPLVFILMGCLMVLGSYLVQTSGWSLVPLWGSLPIGCLVAAILHANDIRDISDDNSRKILTLSGLIGRKPAVYTYVILVMAAYVITAILVLLKVVGPFALLSLLSLPLALKWSKSALTTVLREPNSVDTALLEPRTAGLHWRFGLLFAAGLFVQGFINAGL